MGKRVVNRAKERKTVRIHQAKNEANEEAEKYRSEMEEKLLQIVRRNQEKQDKTNLEIEMTLKNKLRKMQDDYDKNGGQVVKMLLDAVCTVESKVHPNYVLQNNVPISSEKIPNTSHFS